MTLAAIVPPLVAFAAAFQTLVFLVLPARLRTSLAPMTIGIVGAGVSLAAGAIFGFERLGLGIGHIDHAVPWGALTLLLVAAAGTLMLTHRSARAKLADPRIAAWSKRETLGQIMFRIPIMTALIEEAFFRGVLHTALVAVYPTSFAVALGAILFGVWHIGPAIDQAESYGHSRTARSVQVAVTVVATTVAGLGLVWLRIETGAIWAPFAVHALLNMTMATFSRIAATTDWLMRPAVEQAASD